MKPPAFKVGDAVRVLDHQRTGHMRVPLYIRGKVGVVESYCGAYLNPEELAYGRTDGPALHLYRVGFAQTDIWTVYRGAPGDRLFLELYEPWLAPALQPAWNRAA